MDYEEVSVRLRSHPGREEAVQLGLLGTGTNDEQIAEAESRLGVRFPDGYKEFLREFGWGGTGHWEMYGLGRGQPSYLNVVEANVQARRGWGLAAHLVAIMDDGGGNLHCLDTSRLPQCPVVYWDHDLREASSEDAPDFPTFLAQRLDYETEAGV